MTHKRLIILYGPFGDKPDEKYQKLIDGKMVCGYREYAEEFGEIIYLKKGLKTTKSWEHVIANPNDVITYCNSQKDCIVWSVKHDEIKSSILAKIMHPTLYYSCNNQNMYCENADISLVDTNERANQNKFAKLWFKGKNPTKWAPSVNKIYDFVLVGARNDKHESEIVNLLASVPNISYKILWIGGEYHRDKVTHSSPHIIRLTPMLTVKEMHQLLPEAKLGILFTEHPTEGFPQSILEMTMCGIPTIYNMNAPINFHYFNPFILLAKNINHAIRVAIDMQRHYNVVMAEHCRNRAIEHYSLEKSYTHMEELCHSITK